MVNTDRSSKHQNLVSSYLGVLGKTWRLIDWQIKKIKPGVDQEKVPVSCL